MRHMWLIATSVAVVYFSVAFGQENRGPFKVTIKDGRAVIGEATLPIDPTIRIQPQYSGQNSFGLSVEGKRITCSPQGSIWGSVMVDGAISDPFVEFNLGGRIPLPKPLGPTASGKKRIGTESSWKHHDIHITQIIEVVPSKPSGKKTTPGQKRLLDTCRMTYILENKGKAAHRIAFKASIDILIVNNDGALYASPTTHPGQILNGIVLQGKALPDWLWVLEQPSLANPGFVATMTLKHSRGENPYKITLSNLGIVANFQIWDPPAAAAGDSACSLFWEEKELKPGQKRELVWGYGGGISTSPEAEGRVNVGLAGSFEPGKLFTIAAQVEDPLPDQVLSLQLPDGIERVEGRAIQPVAHSSESGMGMVLWKARVVRPGDYEIRVQSSNGSVHSKHVRIEATR